MVSLCMMLLVGLGACEDGSNPLAVADLPEFGESGVDVVDGSSATASAPRVRTVTVDPDSVALHVADTFTVSAEELWPNGRVESDPDVNWRSSDESIVRVSSQGLLSAIAEGEAVVEAARGGRSGAVRVYVAEVPEVKEETTEHEAPSVRTVVLFPDQLTLSEGESFQFSAEEWWPSGGITTDPDVTWVSSSSSVARVDSNGTVSAVAVGSATISASRGGRTGYATLQVEAAPVHEEADNTPDPGEAEEKAEEEDAHEAPSVRTIVVSPEAVNISVTESFKLSAEEWWPSGGITTDPDVTWASSDPSVASVAADGTLSGIAAGSATLSATRSGRSGYASVTVEPQVEESESPSPEEEVEESEDHGAEAGDEEEESEHVAPSERTVVVSPEAVSVSVTETFQLSAEEWWPSGGITTDPDVTWNSSNSAVATVNSSGMVTAVGPGSVEISAARGGRSGSAIVEVQGADNEYGNGSGEEEEGEELLPPPPSFSGGLIPAFPGAEGFGATALSTCNREDTRTFTVTNTNNSGAGSFRQAMADAEAAGTNALKVIVFRVGGYINLSSQIQFEGNCLYVAGQTAPGGGITLRGRGLEFQRGAHDIVIRYLALRLGEAGAGSTIMVRDGTNYVFDHLSLSWSPVTHIRFSRTQIGRSGPIHNVTVQRSLLGESLSPHPTAVQIGGMPDTDEGSTLAGWKEVTHFSLHNNALVSNNHRNINARGLYIEIQNNVIHNWNLDGGQTGRGAIVDWVNNFIQKGPMSRSDRVPFGIRDADINDATFGSSIHATGNVSLGGSGHNDQITSGSVDNWTTKVAGSRSTSEGLLDSYHNDDLTGVVLSDFRRNQTVSSLTSAPELPVTIRDAFTARDRVLNDVGAGMGLDCRGDWVSRMDAVDARLIQEIRNGTGASSSMTREGQAGGFPHLSQGNACADASGNGIPDAWQERFGINASNASIASRIGAGGYTYLEHYLNGTDPR